MVAALLVAAQGHAQDLVLPDYAYDMVAEVTMATTADAKCAGITARPKKVQARMVEMFTRLAGDGVEATAAAAHFQSEAALAEVARREAALREKHGVAAEGDEALCQAIRAEAAENKTVAKMMRIR